MRLGVSHNLILLTITTCLEDCPFQQAPHTHTPPTQKQKRKQNKTKRWHKSFAWYEPIQTPMRDFTENSNPTIHHRTPAKSIFLTIPLMSTSQSTKQIRIPMAKNQEGAIDRQIRNQATSESPSTQNVREISQTSQFKRSLFTLENNLMQRTNAPELPHSDSRHRGSTKRPTQPRAEQEHGPDSKKPNPKTQESPVEEDERATHFWEAAEPGAPGARPRRPQPRSRRRWSCCGRPGRTAARWAAAGGGCRGRWRGGGAASRPRCWSRRAAPSGWRRPRLRRCDGGPRPEARPCAWPWGRGALWLGCLLARRFVSAGLAARIEVVGEEVDERRRSGRYRNRGIPYDYELMMA